MEEEKSRTFLGYIVKYVVVIDTAHTEYIQYWSETKSEHVIALQTHHTVENTQTSLKLCFNIRNNVHKMYGKEFCCAMQYMAYTLLYADILQTQRSISTHSLFQLL